MIRIIVLVLGMVCAARLAAAADDAFIANNIAPYCTGDAPGSAVANELKCSLYIRGVLDGLDVATTLLDKNAVRRAELHQGALRPLRVCEREGVTFGQMIEVAKRYVSDHPELWDMPASLLVLESMRRGFPCV